MTITTNAIIDKHIDGHDRSLVYRFGDSVEVAADNEVLWEGAIVPDWAEPGECMLEHCTSSIVRMPAPEPTLGQQFTAGFAAWKAQLDAGVYTVAEATRQKGHDFLYYGAVGLYLTLKRTDLTNANRQVIVGKWLQGAADITTGMEFYAKASALTAPSAPLLWVSVSDFERVNLSDAEAVSGVIPDDVDLSDGAWLDELLQADASE